MVPTVSSRHILCPLYPAPRLSEWLTLHGCVDTHAPKFSMSPRHYFVTRFGNLIRILTNQPTVDKIGEVCQRRTGGDEAMRYIKSDLLLDTPSREDGWRRDVEVRPGSSLKTDLRSTKTWRATDSLDLMYPSSAYPIVRASWNLANTLSHRWGIVRLNINISKGSPYCPPVFPVFPLFVYY